jgi:hypothetical protein
LASVVSRDRDFSLPALTDFLSSKYQALLLWGKISHSVKFPFPSSDDIQNSWSVYCLLGFDEPSRCDAWAEKQLCLYVL